LRKGRLNAILGGFYAMGRNSILGCC